ncbi:MAG: hypothetical protein AAF378_18070 [Cyanobacteria bacterium P01_A01_bin.84]
MARRRQNLPITSRPKRRERGFTIQMKESKPAFSTNFAIAILVIFIYIGFRAFLVTNNFNVL